MYYITYKISIENLIAALIIKKRKGERDMGNTAVVYKSLYGSTKTYAENIAKEMGANLLEASKVNLEQLKPYDTVIFGGGLYGGTVMGLEVITKNLEALKHKNLIVFTVGLSPTDGKDMYEPKLEKMISADKVKSIKFYHLQGKMDLNELSFKHKIMIKMFKKMLSKRKIEDLPEIGKTLLDDSKKVFDFLDIKTITPLITYVNSL
jgi:menaquinone-dependent protoporphyrinogen IX oxidase